MFGLKFRSQARDLLKQGQISREALVDALTECDETITKILSENITERRHTECTCFNERRRAKLLR